jgi:hypothetical protein
MARKPAKLKPPKKVRAPKKPKASPKVHRIPGTAGSSGTVYHLGAQAHAAASTDLQLEAGGVALELIGEHSVSLAHALSAWTREQDRLANAAWRRPGGLARMGGL